MIDTTTETTSTTMKRMKDLTKTNPDAYRLVFAWLVGAGTINSALGKHIDKAIDYVTTTTTLPAPTFPAGTVSASVISLSGPLEMADPQSRYLIESWVHWKLRVLRMRLKGD